MLYIILGKFYVDKDMPVKLKAFVEKFQESEGDPNFQHFVFHRGEIAAPHDIPNTYREGIIGKPIAWKWLAKFKIQWWVWSRWYGSCRTTLRI